MKPLKNLKKNMYIHNFLRNFIKKLRIFFVLLFILLNITLNPQIVYGRVFDFTKEKLATYLKGGIGTTTLGKSLFEKSSGIGTTYSANGMSLTYSGEIGLLLIADIITFKLGIEFFRPKTIDGLKGTNPSGTELFSLKSDLLGVIPSVGVEYSYNLSKEFRAFIAGQGGFATIDFGNTYDMTPDGTTATGLNDFSEEGGGTSYTGTFSTGIETVFSDNVTFLFEAGYRYLRAENLKYKKSLANTFIGAITKGDYVVDSDGNRKIFEISGPFVSFCFRFYIGM